MNDIKTFLDKTCESHPRLSQHHAFFFHYAEQFLDAFTTRLYCENKETITAYQCLENDYINACVSIKANQPFQKAISQFTQEYSQKYYVIFDTFLGAFKNYKSAFYENQPSYLESALSFICCFPLSKL